MAIHVYSDTIQVTNSFDGALANSTQNGSSVDCLNARRVALVFNTWTGLSTTSNFQLQESSDNSTFTNVTGGTLAVAVPASTADYTQVVNIDMVNHKRYLRVQVIGTGTNGSACANFHLFEEKYLPASQTNAVLSV